jgi:DNA-binding IclR family transcriptional regulator
MASSRQSPPTARVVAVLDHVLAHPQRSFGLSELSRVLGISKPTCLGIVTTLTEHGYLTCHPQTRAYRIGPALLAAGRLARRATPAAELAEPHLRELADRFATSCAASAVVGDEIVVLTTVHARGRHGIEYGLRYPFVPPLGLMYVLWDSDAAIERWLAKAPTLPVTLDTRHLGRITEECRRRGYLVEGLTELGTRLHHVMAGVAAYDLPDAVRNLVGEVVSTLGERVYLGADLSARGRHPTHLLAAPTYDADGRQELVLTLYAGKALTGGEIAKRGRALVATAAAVTAEAGGQPPDWGRTDIGSSA